MDQTALEGYVNPVSKPVLREKNLPLDCDESKKVDQKEFMIELSTNQTLTLNLFHHSFSHTRPATLVQPHRSKPQPLTINPQ